MTTSVCKNNNVETYLRQLIQLTLFAEVKSNDHLMHFLLKGKQYLIVLISVCTFLQSRVNAQQPKPPIAVAPQTGSPPVYLLNIIPADGGKAYTLFRKTKVKLKLNDGSEVSGKVQSVVKDSIIIENAYYALSNINEIRFNPETTLGVVAAIGAAAGIATIAFTADGGKDNERSDGEEIAFWSGVGVTVVSGALLIPNYFIKKKFSRTEYTFRTRQIGG